MLFFHLFHDLFSYQNHAYKKHVTADTTHGDLILIPHFKGNAKSDYRLVFRYNYTGIGRLFEFFSRQEVFVYVTWCLASI